ncbi:hypothetical protein IVB57_12095 [Bradyrhizobium sp. CW9]|uniref:hypothetical protein n=1 Tax=Bradyrhizobium sp. CW9 TaxID=2782689 RepID=UPI001FFC1E48|nr:hypothetical protein [Bradyrhizobium sp. CW9]MCK1329104.1 hypothetical protein [Bradyrhizobium sp. CW9]
MELRNYATLIALRNTVRLAWIMVRAAKALGDLNEALERVVDDQARRRQVDILDVLALLTTDAKA